MSFDRPNWILEVIARAKYGFLVNSKDQRTKCHVEYRARRWHRLDNEGNVVKIARTYFDVMQP